MQGYVIDYDFIIDNDLAALRILETDYIIDFDHTIGFDIAITGNTLRFKSLNWSKAGFVSYMKVKY